MYLGQHVVYDFSSYDVIYMLCGKLHANASYAYRKHDNAGKRKHVLYYLGDDTQAFKRHRAFTYICKGSVSKTLLKAGIDVDLTKLMMPDNARHDCTYASVTDDMKHNLMFNKVDMSKHASLVKMPYDLFKLALCVSAVDLCAERDLRLFPCWPRVDCFFTKSGEFARVSDVSHDFKLSKRCRVDVLDSSPETSSERNRSGSCPHGASSYSDGGWWTRMIDADFSTLEDFYNAADPHMVMLTLENGEQLKGEQAVTLAKKPLVKNVVRYSL